MVGRREQSSAFVDATVCKNDVWFNGDLEEANII
jgi:hypothetical protein